MRTSPYDPRSTFTDFQRIPCQIVIAQENNLLFTARIAPLGVATAASSWYLYLFFFLPLSLPRLLKWGEIFIDPRGITCPTVTVRLLRRWRGWNTMFEHQLKFIVCPVELNLCQHLQRSGTNVTTQYHPNRARLRKLTPTESKLKQLHSGNLLVKHDFFNYYKFIHSKRRRSCTKTSPCPVNGKLWLFSSNFVC